MVDAPIVKFASQANLRAAALVVGDAGDETKQPKVAWVVLTNTHTAAWVVTFRRNNAGATYFTTRVPPGQPVVLPGFEPQGTGGLELVSDSTVDNTLSAVVAYWKP